MNDNNKVPINIDVETAKGAYSTVVYLTHTEEEFILDFGTMLPGMDGPVIVSRVIMSPQHAKRLQMALKDNIKIFESTFGTINTKNPENKETFALNPFGPNKNKS